MVTGTLGRPLPTSGPMKTQNPYISYSVSDGCAGVLSPKCMSFQDFSHTLCSPNLNTINPFPTENAYIIPTRKHATTKGVYICPQTKIIA